MPTTRLEWDYSPFQCPGGINLLKTKVKLII